MPMRCKQNNHHITHHTSHITRHTSHVTHQTSHVTNHTSQIKRDIVTRGALARGRLPVRALESNGAAGEWRDDVDDAGGSIGCLR